jgi:hypothetical protein
MINPHHVAELLSNLISERLSLDDCNNTDSKLDEDNQFSKVHNILSKLNILLILTVILIPNNYKMIKRRMKMTKRRMQMMKGRRRR